MSRVNFKGLFLAVFALASFQFSSCLPADSSARRIRENKLTDQHLAWLAEMDLPETQIRQKRLYMKGKKAEARNEDLDESTEALNGFEGERIDAPQAKILQKRIFMDKKKPGGDAPKDRYAYIPEREGSEIANERASDLKKLLSLRDRVRDFHAKVDHFIDRYRSNDENQENTMAGNELDDAQLLQWEKILNGFDTD